MCSRERGRAPGGERVLRRGDRAVDLLDAREVDRAGLAAGCGVVDRAGSSRRALDDAAADPVADPADVLLLLDWWAGQLGHLEPPRVSVQRTALQSPDADVARARRFRPRRRRLRRLEVGFGD